jgi:hypothetical protein
MEFSDKKLDRYTNAVTTFGTSGSRYVEGKQLQRDLAFMNKKYEEGGKWEEGKKHAIKELFKKIFKTNG